MDAGTIIAIAVGAILLIALFVFISRKQRTRRTEQRRVEARGHREEARVRGARATRAEAEAEERAARAKREQAIAEEAAATAERERRFARSKERTANELDPDHDGTPGRDRTAESDRTHSRR